MFNLSVVFLFSQKSSYAKVFKIRKSIRSYNSDSALGSHKQTYDSNLTIKQKSDSKVSAPYDDKPKDSNRIIKYIKQHILFYKAKKITYVKHCKDFFDKKHYKDG